MGRFDAGFEGTVALVTGGASGIGRATCRRLAEEGATVIVADLDAAGAKTVAEEIGGEAVTLDVGDPGAWAEVVGGVLARHGGLHLAYLNAGVTTLRAEPGDLVAPFDITAVSDEAYRRIMGANVDGVILGTRACAPAIARSGGGAIVATASAAGVIAFPPDPIYTATKHAVVGFVRSMAPWLEAQGIACHAVLPGVVDTNILTRGFADEARSRGILVMDPSEIAAGVVGAVRSPETGGLWLCLPGRAPSRYVFNPVEGLGVPGPEDQTTP
jgi:NAD(P)-dependent dehydrogenase (short-subunit alcohol dehydrogenase family)